MVGKVISWGDMKIQISRVLEFVTYIINKNNNVK